MTDAPGTRSYIPPSEEERLKQRVAELEAENQRLIEEATENLLFSATLEAENDRLREAALLAMRCKTLTEAAEAKAALAAALTE